MSRAPPVSKNGNIDCIAAVKVPVTAERFQFVFRMKGAKKAV
jgi:hypothetical protein